MCWIKLRGAAHFMVADDEARQIMRGAYTLVSRLPVPELARVKSWFVNHQLTRLACTAFSLYWFSHFIGRHKQFIYEAIAVKFSILYLWKLKSAA